MGALEDDAATASTGTGEQGCRPDFGTGVKGAGAAAAAITADCGGIAAAEASGDEPLGFVDPDTGLE